VRCSACVRPFLKRLSKAPRLSLRAEACRYASLRPTLEAWMDENCSKGTSRLER
jgi:hypothetical protein